MLNKLKKKITPEDRYVKKYDSSPAKNKSQMRIEENYRSIGSRALPGATQTENKGELSV